MSSNVASSGLCATVSSLAPRFVFLFQPVEEHTRVQVWLAPADLLHTAEERLAHRRTPAVGKQELLQPEIDELWEKLSEGGEKQRCGWLKDKYGVSWQIIPSVLGEMLRDKDGEKSKRVMEAMLQMDKIDIDGLEHAYEQ